MRVGWIAVGVVAGPLLAVAPAWDEPARYRASCTLDYGREPVLADEHNTLPNEMERERWRRTQDIVLASHAVATRAVHALGSPREQLDLNGAATLLQEHSTFSRVEETNLVRITVEDGNAERAARLADALAEAYRSKADEDASASSNRAAQLLASQLEAVAQRLARSESELGAFLERPDVHGVPLEQRIEGLQEETRRLEQSLTDTRLQRMQLSARLAKLKAVAENQDAFLVRTQELEQDEQMKVLRAEYVAARVKQKELEAATDAPTQATQAAQARLAGIVEAMTNTIQANVRLVQAELTGTQGLETQLQAALNRADAASREAQLQRVEFTRIERERADAQAFLSAIRERSIAVKLANATAGRGPTLVEAAIPPREPVPERLLLRAVFGAIAGALLGALTGALRAWWSERRRALDSALPARAEPPEEPEHGRSSHLSA